MTSFPSILGKGQPFLKSSSHTAPLGMKTRPLKAFCGSENSGHNICAFCMSQIIHTLFLHSCFKHSKAVPSQFSKYNDFLEEKNMHSSVINLPP